MTSNYIQFSKQTGLSDSDILDIRMMGDSGASRNEIAENFNIDPTTAGRILNRRTWSHVPEPRSVGSYAVFPDGRIYSMNSRRFMKPVMGKDGQLYVELRANSKREKVAVAQMVATAFLGTRSKKVQFVDGNTSNPHFTNLRVGK